MALFSFIIISLINSMFSLSQENEYNTINNYYIESNEFNPIKSFDVIAYLSDISDDQWREILILILKSIKKTLM